MPGDPSLCYAPEPTILERRAADLLGRYHRAAGEGHAAEDAARPHDKAQLKSATRWAIGLAIAAGIVSGGLIGGSEIWLRDAVSLDDMDLWEALPWWAGWFAAAGVVSAIEIAFLYWVALRGIGDVVRVAPVELGDRGYSGLVARGFARGALEFPNPRSDIFGIDPYAYVPRWQLVVRTVAYKVKVGVSSFILRVFLRRVAARMAIRGMVPLMAGPLYAAWNAYIIWRIMREARVRAYGPGAVDSFFETRLGGEAAHGEAAAVMLHGVGELTRRAGDMHPNYVYLVARLCDRLGIDGQPPEIDWPAHRDSLERLDEGEKEAVLELLLLAAVLGSRTYRRQRELVDEAFASVGRERPKGGLRDLRRRLSDGQLEIPEALRRAAGAEADGGE